MAALSDYLENRLIDFTLRGQAFTAPTNVYVGLLTAGPSDAGGGTEVTGGAYARATVAATAASWGATQGTPGTANTTATSTGSSGTTYNNATITFATPTATWGSVTHIGVYDAASAGNLLFYATLTTPKTINSGDTVSFAPGALTFQIDN